MEIFAGLSVVCLILVSLMVAAKTFALWSRTRALPELLLALMLCFATVIGYPLVIASSQIPRTELWPIHVGGIVSINLGFACLMLFTLTVFRSGSLFAKCFAALVMSMLAAGTLSTVTDLGSANPRSLQEQSGVALFCTIPITAAYFWTTFESLSYHRRLSLQLRLGLANAVVTNRVLLWGLMTLSAGSAVVVNACGLLTGVLLSPLIVTVSSVLGLGQAVCLFLAFHTPTWYKSWLEQRHAAQGA